MKRWLPYVVILAGAWPLLAETPRPDLAFDTVVVTADAVKATVVNRGAASSYGCNIDLRLFDSQTNRIAGSRRRAVDPLPPGRRQEVVFPMEPDFAGRKFRLVVDSLNRVSESDEKNNISPIVETPLPRPGPIRIPKDADHDDRRPPPIRIPGTTLPPRPPKDPAQPDVDLAAEEVTTNGVVLKGTVRNVSAREFSGHRKAILSREVIGNFHVLERADVAEKAIPPLVPGEAFVIEVDSPHKNKEARRYVYRLSIDPPDDNADNDAAEKTIEQVRLD